jgi:hypothetical protein
VLLCCCYLSFFPSYIVATMATKQYSETDLSGKGSDPEQASPHISSAAGSDLDDNYNLYKQHEGEAPADSAEAKSVLRKIDWRVMPVLWTLYLLQYLDKNGLNYVCFFLLPQIFVGKSISIWLVSWLYEILHDQLLMLYFCFEG